ncbi:MAG: helix-hairpin-helix domain-containing protein [Candidatus Omnitrophota bacterium]
MNKEKKLTNGKASVPERVIVAALSIFLFSASVILFARDSRPLASITVESGGIKEKLSLVEVEENLKEARRVPVNTATAEEITVIPGIGPAISSRIVEYREKYGSFSTVEALIKVKGIGPAKLEKMREYVKID